MNSFVQEDAPRVQASLAAIRGYLAECGGFVEDDADPEAVPTILGRWCCRSTDQFCTVALEAWPTLKIAVAFPVASTIGRLVAEHGLEIFALGVKIGCKLAIFGDELCVFSRDWIAAESGARACLYRALSEGRRHALLVRTILAQDFGPRPIAAVAAAGSEIRS